jgi:hypothetical protein
MQENLQEPDEPGVVEFDAAITNRADVDGLGDPLQQGKVHMYIQHCAWKPAKRSVMD